MKSQIHAVFGKLMPGIFSLLIFATADARGIQAGNKPQDTAAAVKDAGAKSSARDTATGRDTAANYTAAVAYLGSVEDMIVFNVSYPNPEGNKFQLTIKDQDGEKLYQDFFSERSFYRQFRLPKGDKQKIAFVFRDKSGAETVKTFEINVNSRTIREVAVRKVY